MKNPLGTLILQTSCSLDLIYGLENTVFDYFLHLRECQDAHLKISDKDSTVMKRVFINGYGSIGRRLVEFLLDDPEVEITGVGKHTPDAKIDDIRSKGLDTYVPESGISRFEGRPISGTIKSALAKSDIVIDASPGGIGYTNKTELYDPCNISAIYQGGETITGPRAVSHMIFNSRTNYESAIHARHVMQGSCNVTGMGRVLVPLNKAYGDMISRIDVILIRRWADIEQTEKSIPDTIEMTQSPHHGQDVLAALGSNEVSLYVRAIKVPTRQMHLHVMDVRFASDTPKTEEIHAMLKGEPGIAVLETPAGTAQIRECAKDMGFSFVDTNLIHVHANMSSVHGDTVQIMYSDDQTGIVIPENHMLLQAMLDGRSYEDAWSHTKKVFHMEEKKQALQDRFAA